MATNPVQPPEQNLCLIEDYSRNISLKLLSKISAIMMRQKKDLLSLFRIISLWKLKIVIATKTHEQWQQKYNFKKTNVINIL